MTSFGAGPTFAAQSSLPRLPVPTLENTMKLWLASTEPLQTEAEFAESRALADDFVASSGGLQALLEARKAACDGATAVVQVDAATGRFVGHPDGTQDNSSHWLEKWWEELAYLAGRDSLACYVNPFGVLFSNGKCYDPMMRAAWCVAGALSFYRRLGEGEGDVPPECIGKSVLCSAQYQRIFSTNRQPGIEQDELVTYSDSKHIAVHDSGRWYIIPDVTSMTVASIAGQLEAVKNDGDAVSIGGRELKPSRRPVAALTGADRTHWATARAHLIASDGTGGNEENLRLIESAIFHVVIDRSSPDTLPDLLEQAQVRIIHEDKGECTRGRA